MGFRFFRRFKILPGLRLNVSKSGVSLSAGARGASVTMGKRGVYGNFGIPGTGLSYRARLDSTGAVQPEQSARADSNEPSLEEYLAEFPPVSPRLYTPEPIEPRAVHGKGGSEAEHFDELAYWTSIDLLRQRELRAIDWSARVAVLSHGDPVADDPDEFDRHARAVSLGMVARRVLEGDTAAWAEVLAEELRNERIPFDFSFDFEVEEDDRIRIALQLPDTAVLGFHEPVMQARAEYEDVCCALMLRFAHEVFRVLPEAAEVHLTGYRLVPSPATGKPFREILLRLMCDRSSVSSLALDSVDPSAAFEALGGASKTRRGELIPLVTEELSEGGSWKRR